MPFLQHSLIPVPYVRSVARSCAGGANTLRAKSFNVDQGSVDGNRVNISHKRRWPRQNDHALTGAPYKSVFKIHRDNAAYVVVLNFYNEIGIVIMIVSRNPGEER